MVNILKAILLHLDRRQLVGVYVIFYTAIVLLMFLLFAVGVMSEPVAILFALTMVLGLVAAVPIAEICESKRRREIK